MQCHPRTCCRPLLLKLHPTTPNYQLKISVCKRSPTLWTERSTTIGLLRKKYKGAKKVVNRKGAGCGGLLTLRNAFSFVCLSVSLPLGGLWGLLPSFFPRFILSSRKLESKTKKNGEIITLAFSKRDTVNRLLLRALNDNAVSVQEFDINLSEFVFYNFLNKSDPS